MHRYPGPLHSLNVSLKVRGEVESSLLTLLTGQLFGIRRSQREG